MIKSSKHILKFQNKGKTDILNQIFIDYEICLKEYIRLICCGELPLQNFCSSKLLPIISFESSKWRRICYEQASRIIRSNLKCTQNKTYIRYKKVYKYFLKNKRQQMFIDTKFKDLKINIMKRCTSNITKISLQIPADIFNTQKGISFDLFIRLTVPYKKSKGRYHTINLPIKEHKHSLKFKDWKRKDFIELTKNSKGQIFLGFVYEKDAPDKKESGSAIGFDSGYKKLLSDSNGEHHGSELNDIYLKLSNKQKHSKAYKRLLQHKKNEINRVCNSLEFTNIQTVVVEDLHQVKHKSKLSTKTMNKMQYWSYKQVLDKLEDRSELEGFYFIKVNPAYTSQTCSGCGTICKSNRKGEKYKCSCGLEMDADTNAAINILRRGIYSSSSKENFN